MKKIFFNYSNDSEDGKMMRNLSLHFSVLKDKVDLWHKGKLLPGDTVDEALSDNLNNSDAVLHLLSISYAAEEDCMELLEQGIQKQKKNIPVLLSSFDWQSVDAINKLEDELLPQDHQPVDTHANYNEIYTEIVQTVRSEVLGVKSKGRPNDRLYYYILATLILAAGAGISLWAKSIFDHLGITVGVFSLSVIGALFTLRHIIFPTSVSTSKF